MVVGDWKDILQVVWDGNFSFFRYYFDNGVNFNYQYFEFLIIFFIESIEYYYFEIIIYFFVNGVDLKLNVGFSFDFLIVIVRKVNNEVVVQLLCFYYFFLFKCYVLNLFRILKVVFCFFGCYFQFLIGQKILDE